MPKVLERLAQRWSSRFQPNDVIAMVHTPYRADEWVLTVFSDLDVRNDTSVDWIGEVPVQANDQDGWNRELAARGIERKTTWETANDGTWDAVCFRPSWQPRGTR
jgi:hypothetical protein